MINIENDNLICLALKEHGQVGPKTFQQLLMIYGHPGNIYDHPAEDIASMTSINMERAEKIIASQDMIDDVYDTWDQLQSLNISVISFLDKDYPDSLRQIADPPVVLYTKGNLDLLNRGSVAIVGTTQADQDGIRASVDFARELSGHDQTIISGLALGIDSAAHLGCLKSGGKTVAVLGSGLMNIYPEENESLAGLIAESGVIISEYDIHADAIPGRLISRNRLIAGLASAVLIIQVGEKRRGELHAAQAAIDQGKPVFVFDPNDQYDHETLLNNMTINIKGLEQIDEIMKYIV
ncbi:MAG: DNA-processing protein DprA [candidate division Zixibacteria bacterium]|nr:DNA-processing protein DprA [candidate division Zixibacteria bacterium]